MSTSVSLGEIVERETAGFVCLDSHQIEAVERHYELLLRWNRRMNLTTVTKLPEAAIRHYCESLFLAARLTAGRVVDVGSGAGFPGIPVAIARPECFVDLVESHQRKAVFLREASRGMGNVGVIGARAESLLPPGRSASRPSARELEYASELGPLYDWMVSRAVNPAELMRLPLARRYALLIGGDDLAVLRPEEVTPLPWGSQRVLAIGTFHVKRAALND
jgi:16S rRNA (guanine527-N7)-methyltransferase